MWVEVWLLFVLGLVYYCFRRDFIVGKTFELGGGGKPNALDFQTSMIWWQAERMWGGSSTKCGHESECRGAARGTSATTWVMGSRALLEMDMGEMLDSLKLWRTAEPREGTIGSLGTTILLMPQATKFWHLAPKTEVLEGNNLLSSWSGGNIRKELWIWKFELNVRRLSRWKAIDGFIRFVTGRNHGKEECDASIWALARIHCRWWLAQEDCSRM